MAEMLAKKVILAPFYDIEEAILLVRILGGRKKFVETYKLSHQLHKSLQELNSKSAETVYMTEYVHYFAVFCETKILPIDRRVYYDILPKETWKEFTLRHYSYVPIEQVSDKFKRKVPFNAHPRWKLFKPKMSLFMKLLNTYIIIYFSYVLWTYL